MILFVPITKGRNFSIILYRKILRLLLSQIVVICLMLMVHFFLRKSKMKSAHTSFNRLKVRTSYYFDNTKRKNKQDQRTQRGFRRTSRVRTIKRFSSKLVCCNCSTLFQDFLTTTQLCSKQNWTY